MQPAILVIELLGQLLEYKTSDIFRRWVVFQKKGQFVQILVVHFLKGLSGCGFHFSEIDQNAAFVQRLAPQNHLNFPVVTVEIFTLPAKASQAVGGSKTAAYLNFKQLFAQS
jgi:hypothetical protein